MINSSNLAQILTGSYLQHVRDFPVSYLITDSRKAVFNESSLFFAIRGNIHDGHDYIEELYGNKVRQFIIEKENLDVRKYPEANFFLVSSSIQAIQELAAHVRQQFDLDILAITGSNGKTILKEWLSTILSWKFNVVKSPKSFNSQIGVPLSIWQINEKYDIGVFEAGISKTGEMARLEKIIKPDMGIFTNLGSAHDEGFTSRSEKLKEKLVLFTHAKSLVYRKDDTIIDSAIRSLLPDIEKITWGIDPDSEYRVEEVSIHDNHANCLFSRKGRRYEFNLKFTDDASIENLSHCIVFLLHNGWSRGEIQDGLDSLHPISMRLEMKKGINNTYLIDDTYNNDLAGLEIALKFLENQHQRDKKSLILSDLLQTGIHSDELYRYTASMLNDQGLDKVIGIGHEIRQMEKYMHPGFTCYENTDAFLQHFDLDTFNNEIVLVKGARPFEMERIVRTLQEKIHGTVLEINLDAISHNLNVYRSFLQPSTRVMVMVKALAYGSGSIEVANLLEFHRVDYLGVAYADEGVTLRKNGINLPIMIMNPSLDALDMIKEFRLEPEIYNLRLLHAVDQYTRKNQCELNIHLKLDTGMNRLGFEQDDLADLANILQDNPFLRVASVFSHLSSADDTNQDDFTRHQVAVFEEGTRIIKERIQQAFLRHIANSAAIVRNPEYHYDMVRLGIGLYGYDASGRINPDLKPIGTWRTEISQIKHLHKGDSVGYGRKGLIRKDSTIATIAVGYADGFFRAFGNGKGHVLVKGKPASVIGNVCMDMSMIDITGIDAREGDEVIIFGKEQSLKILSDCIHTIPYEILTNISERVKRIYISE